jgi:hypothetical protein
MSELAIHFPSMGPEQDHKHGTCLHAVKGLI